MLGMKIKMNNGMVAVVAFLLAGNLSPLGMRALDCLNIEPPLADVALSMALFAITGAIYWMLRHMYLKNNEENK